MSRFAPPDACSTEPGRSGSVFVPGTPLVMTIEQTCATLNVSRGTVYNLLRSNRLASVKLGAKRLISIASAMQLLGDAGLPELAAGGDGSPTTSRSRRL